MIDCEECPLNGDADLKHRAISMAGRLLDIAETVVYADRGVFTQVYGDIVSKIREQYDEWEEDNDRL